MVLFLHEHRRGRNQMWLWNGWTTVPSHVCTKKIMAQVCEPPASWQILGTVEKESLPPSKRDGKTGGWGLTPNPISALAFTTILCVPGFTQLPHPVVDVYPAHPWPYGPRKGIKSHRVGIPVMLHFHHLPLMVALHSSLPCSVWGFDEVTRFFTWS